MEQPEELLRLGRDFSWFLSNIAQFQDDVWTVTETLPDSTFIDEVHAGVAELEEQSLWFTVRNELILRYIQASVLPTSIWEVGAGTGVVARSIARTGTPVVAVEPSFGGASGAASGGVFSIASTLESLHLPTQCLPAIGLFDVIEHLDHPAGLLNECHRVLEPEGRLFITVPAVPWLWSDSDDTLGHYRRYTKTSLTQDLESCGFIVQDCSYRLWSLVLPVALIRSLPYRLRIRGGGRARIDRELGFSSQALSRLLLLIERAAHGRSPIGTSLFALAMRP